MNFNGINNSAEKAPVPTVEKKEAGMENIEGQIDTEAQNLDKAVEDIQTELESIGGEEGLEKMIDKLTPEQQAKVRQSIQYRFESLKGRLAGLGILGGGFGASLMGVVNNFHNSDYGVEHQDWGIKELAVAAGVGAVIASWGTLKRLFSEYQNNKYIEDESFNYQEVHGAGSHSGRKVYEYSNRSGELHPKTQAEKDRQEKKPDTVDQRDINKMGGNSGRQGDSSGKNQYRNW